MLEQLSVDTNCVICSNPTCLDRKSGLFILDPDTLDSSIYETKSLSAPRAGRFSNFVINKGSPTIPHFVEHNNKKFIKFNGKLNTSALIRCSKILNDIKEVEAANYAMEMAHKFYKKKPTRDEKFNCVAQLHNIMYPQEEVPMEFILL